MKIKRLLSFGSALVLSLSSLLFINLGHAFAAVKTWSGTAGDGKLATAGNWTGGVAPVTGDSITFPKNTGSSDVVLINDLGAGVCINGITAQPNDAGKFSGYILGGASLYIQGTYTGASSNGLTIVNTTLCGNFTVAANSTLSFGSYGNVGTLAVTSYTVNLGGIGATLASTSVITGTGAMSGVDGSTLIFTVDSPAYSGTINSAGSVYLSSGQAAGTGNIIMSGPNGQFNVCTYPAAVTIANNITVGGNYGINVQCLGGSGTVSLNATLTGTVTLSANTLASLGGGDLNINGPLHGAFTIAPAPGAPYTLVVNSSDNTSLTPNGTTGAPAQTITVNSGDNQPGSYVSIGTNQTYVIDGVRGDTFVGDKGTLMGTGVVGNLSVVAGGIVAPGHSPGCLSTSNFTLDGTYQAELGGTVACSGYDQLKVTGTVTLGGTSPTTTILNTSIYGAFKPAKGNVFTIINNDGSDAVVGTFANLAEGATFKVGGNVFKISYKGGDGNDVTLTVLTAAAPDTGIAMITTHPAETFGITSLMAAGIYLISRKQKAFLKK
jgi:fibronectin-binding autotransporter adhesin